MYKPRYLKSLEGREVVAEYNTPFLTLNKYYTIIKSETISSNKVCISIITDNGKTKSYDLNHKIIDPIYGDSNYLFSLIYKSKDRRIPRKR